MSSFSDDKHFWHTEQVFDDAAIYFEELIHSLEHAVARVNVDFYIFKYDELGKRVIGALTRAAKRGVEIRVVIDGVGSGDSANIVASVLDHANISVRIFRPLPWYLTHYQWSFKDGSKVKKMLYYFASLNRRDHRKLCTIDSKFSFCGSLNIAQYHIDTGTQRSPWHDYGVKLEGKNVGLLDEDFSAFWSQQAHNPSKHNITNFLSNASPAKRSARNSFVSRKIANARKTISICSAYFSPSGAILKALSAACTRGVAVNLIVSAKSDIFLSPLLTSTYYSDLLGMGVRVFEYQRGILHAKLMLIDDECIIGSSNLNHRSYYHDLELDVVLTTSAAITSLKSKLARDRANSHEITPPSLRGLNKVKLFGWLPRIFRYWS